MQVLKSLDLYPNGIVGVKSEIDGKIVRTTFFPGQDISGQTEAVKSFCNSVWTAEVVSAYEASLASA
jgi:hypothetical protein